MLAQSFLPQEVIKGAKNRARGRFVFASLLLCVLALTIFLISCSSKPTDMRSLAPADALVYLETNDVAAALQPIVDSKPFKEAAKYKPDLSALKGVQLAVAVTGFETSEEKVTDDTSNANIRPHFVAIADTHAWNFQAVKFAEQKLGGFVAKIYGSDPSLERSEKNGGMYFTWTSPDQNGAGRKAYALVIDSLIYFGNDESSIDKALAVRRGEADSIVKAGTVQPTDPQTLARAYVSPDGIAQIANLAALQAATISTDDSELRSAITVVLPKLIRDAVSDIRWESRAAPDGIEDRFAVSMPSTPTPDANEILSELVDSFFEDIESTSGEDVAAAIADRNDNTTRNTVYRREDHFTSTTAERRIVTDLGFIGWIITQLNEE